MVGRKILHYDILEKLGEGGMGVVYKARDTLLDRFVALKFLPSWVKDEAEEAQLLREARSAAALNHPSICTIHAVEEAGGKKFLVLEFVEGNTVRARRQTGPLRIDQVIDWGVQTAEGLRAAHDRGIIHRDVKSENLMITPDGRVKIMDFGLARLRSGSVSGETRTTAGTLAYMSPEQLQGGNPDERSDIWSLGVVLFELLTGQLPFRGEHEAALMYSILNDEPPSLSSLRGDVPAHLGKVVETALRKDRDLRYKLLNELLADLKLEEGTGTDGPKQKSLVVLPFGNTSPEKETEYFSDGLTDEIISRLSQIRSMRVISRTSSRRYKNSDLPIRQLARELQVEFVLEGSVRKHGRDLRITAQLIDAARDANIWAETYKGTIDQVFDFQEDVAAKIAEGLELQLTAMERMVLKKRYTANPEAYQLYLRGRSMWARRDEEDVRKGAAYFQQAVESDPAYALAYTGLADSYNILGFYTYAAPHLSFPLARAAAEKALAIDSTLAEAMCSLAYTEHYHSWDWARAESLYRRAITINEKYFTAHQFYANLLASMGELDKSLAEFKRAQAIDPLSSIVNAAIGWLYNYQRKYDAAIAQLRQTIEWNPSFFLSHLWLGIAYRRKGLMNEAIAAMKNASDLSGESTIAMAGLGHAYAAAGMRNEAGHALEKLMERSRGSYVSSYYIALISEALGDRDSAFSHLGKAVLERSHYVTFLDVDPDLDSIRGDDRYALLRSQFTFKR